MAPGVEPINDSILPFEIRIDDAVLEDLRQRLAHTRIPDEVANVGWEYGMPYSYLRELTDYWQHSYDWRVQEAKLNEFDHFRASVGKQLVHFIHARSPHPNAFPLLLTHGWPGSVVEFLEVIPRLTNPERFGGDVRDAFHVIAPSLPGYGFSEATLEPGWDIRRVARVFIELLATLGYERYGAQGGDWGAQVTTRIALFDPEHCAAIHVNMPIASKPADGPPLTEQEQADLKDFQRFQRDESAYAMLQMTKPQTVSAALNDSPAGLLAWIIEKFHSWSDCNGHPENVFTRDQLITNVMLYWTTQTIASSARLYRETRIADAQEKTPPFVAVPTGVARYPKEILRFPRSWVEQRYNVTHWNDMPRGGHFAAMEQPELFVADVQTFFRTIR